MKKSVISSEKSIYKLVITTLFLFSIILTQAAIRLPSVIGNHMVLQQNSEVKLWGWCSPAEKITIKTTWDTLTYRLKGEPTAKWSQLIKTPSAGGPYKITVNETVLEDVMIGEVWLCSGQSNMERGMQPQQAVDEAKNENITNIRLLHVAKSSSEYPQENCMGSWKVCTSEELKQFSAVGYFFAKNLQKNLNVPVGMINSSWGGTAAEVWTPKELIENNAQLKAASQKLAPSTARPIIPGYLFNAMIYPITNFELSGVIWYQGENNVLTCSAYQQLLTTLIGSWRAAWNKEFPFYFVQIAPYSGYGNNNFGALLREAQTNCLSVSKTGMVVISDLVDNIADIHPKDKMNVGYRLVNLALSDNYGKKGLIYRFPLYKTMTIEKEKIRIDFMNAENGLVCKGKTISDFYIAGDDRQFLPAVAKIEGSSVVVSNKTIKNPVAVRFGFTNAAMPNLFSKEGLPVNLFRTDDWNEE